MKILGFEDSGLKEGHPGAFLIRALLCHVCLPGMVFEWLLPQWILFSLKKGEGGFD